MDCCSIQGVSVPKTQARLQICCNSNQNKPANEEEKINKLTYFQNENDVFNLNKNYVSNYVNDVFNYVLKNAFFFKGLLNAKCKAKQLAQAAFTVCLQLQHIRLMRMEHV